MVESPCSSRDSQESSPTPQFKSINSSVLSFLYNPLQCSCLENSVDYSPMGSQRVRHDYLLIIITNDTSNSYHLGSYYCDLSTLFVLSHGKGLTPFSDKVTEAPVLRPPDAKN